MARPALPRTLTDRLEQSVSLFVARGRWLQQGAVEREVSEQHDAFQAALFEGTVREGTWSAVNLSTQPGLGDADAPCTSGVAALREEASILRFRPFLQAEVGALSVTFGQDYGVE